jgi:voltage-gated potassium channel
MVTASIAAFFVGEDEKLLRREMHRDLRQLRGEVAQLIDEEERRLRREMHADIRELRDEVRRLREALEAQREGSRGG